MVPTNHQTAGENLGVRVIRNTYQDGKKTYRTGYGDVEARVYAPESEGQAQRNLNFARANLKAYLDWMEEEPLRKKKAEEESKSREVYSSRALRAYNSQGDTKHTSWESVFSPSAVSKTVVDAWIKLVKDIDASYVPKVVSAPIVVHNPDPYAYASFRLGGNSFGM